MKKLVTPVMFCLLATGAFAQTDSKKPEAANIVRAQSSTAVTEKKTITGEEAVRKAAVQAEEEKLLRGKAASPATKN